MPITMEGKKPLGSVISADIDRQVRRLVERIGVTLHPGPWYECTPVSYVDKYATWGGLPIILEVYLESAYPRKLGAAYVYLPVDGDDAYLLYMLRPNGRITGASFWMSM